MKKQSQTVVSLTIAIPRYTRDHVAFAISEVSLYSLNLQSIVFSSVLYSHHRQQYFHNASVKKIMRGTLELHIPKGNRFAVDIQRNKTISSELT